MIRVIVFYTLERIIGGFGLIRLFSDPRTPYWSFWCDTCSINAIGELDVKSQLSKYL